MVQVKFMATRPVQFGVRGLHEVLKMNNLAVGRHGRRCPYHETKPFIFYKK